MKDLGLLILRLTVGTLVAGHGSQKTFGWFGGPGLKGTQGMMEQLGMKPGKVWGSMAAASELQGGLLTALGFLNPLGPLTVASTMAVAIRRAHWGKPIWNTGGGAELPLTNMVATTALALMGPGRYSLDRLFGIRIPRSVSALYVAMSIGFTYLALQRPDVVQTVLDRASGAMSGSTSSVFDMPDLEVETRPRPVEESPVASQVGM